MDESRRKLLRGALIGASAGVIVGLAGADLSYHGILLAVLIGLACGGVGSLFVWRGWI